MRDFQLPGRSPVLATNAMCVTSHPLAAKIALDILQAGGNAADAAIAGAVLLGIAEPQSCGIGGDCFVLVKPAGAETVVALNGSGRAPAGLSSAALRARGMTSIGTETIKSVTVPVGRRRLRGARGAPRVVGGGGHGGGRRRGRQARR